MQSTNCFCQILIKFEFSHSKKNSARCYKKYTHVLMQSTSCFCQILIKFEFSNSKKNSARCYKNMYTRLNAKYQLFLSNFN
jgi:hypothetical protein